MRNLTFGLRLHEGKLARATDAHYALTFHTNVQDDLQVQPLLCVHATRVNRSDRVLAIWSTGLQVGKHVLRVGYLCEDAVDEKMSLHWHPGPRQAALDHFHGLFGPRWPVKLDGVLGYFTVPIDHPSNESDVVGVVHFRTGHVPGPEQCPDCGETILTVVDHAAGCTLVGKLLLDLGIQLHPDAPSGKPIPREQWGAMPGPSGLGKGVFCAGQRHGVTYSQALALTRTEPDSAARLREDMLLAWGAEVQSEVEEWQSRARRLGLQWQELSAEVDRAAHAKGGPLHRETVTPVADGEVDLPSPTPDHTTGPARARLKVRLTSYFGPAGGADAWLAEHAGGKRADSMTAAEADAAFAALTTWAKGRPRIGGIPAKFTRAQLEVMEPGPLSVLFAEHFPGHVMDGSRKHIVDKLLTVPIRPIGGVRRKGA